MATRRPTEPPTDKTVAPAPTPVPAKRVRAKSPTPPAPRVRKTAAKAAAPVAVSEDVRRGMIAKAAYLRAERRGFAPGGEHEDWTAAEAEVDALLKAGHNGTSQ
jgi:hypothetical protein